MPGEDYTPDGTFPTFPLTLVKDGETYNWDTLMKSGDPKRGLFQKLINAVGWLKDNVGSQTLGTPTSETRFINDVPLYDDSKWTFGGEGDLVSINDTTAAIAYWPLSVPHGQILTSVSVYILPAGSHGGLPGTMPVMTVYKKNVSTNTQTQIATKTDASGSVGAYEVVHALTPTSFTETIDRATYKYYVKFVNEGGANALQSLDIIGVSYTITRSTIGSD